MQDGFRSSTLDRYCCRRKRETLATTNVPQGQGFALASFSTDFRSSMFCEVLIKYIEAESWFRPQQDLIMTLLQTLAALRLSKENVANLVAKLCTFKPWQAMDLLTLTSFVRVLEQLPLPSDADTLDSLGHAVARIPASQLSTIELVSALVVLCASTSPVAQQSIADRLQPFVENGKQRLAVSMKTGKNVPVDICRLSEIISKMEGESNKGSAKVEAQPPVAPWSDSGDVADSNKELVKAEAQAPAAPWPASGDTHLQRGGHLIPSPHRSGDWRRRKPRQKMASHGFNQGRCNSVCCCPTGNTWVTLRL